jgi:hypothetical protein
MSSSLIPSSPHNNLLYELVVYDAILNVRSCISEFLEDRRIKYCEYNFDGVLSLANI